MTYQPMSRLDLWYYKAARDKRRQAVMGWLREMVEEAQQRDGDIHVWVGDGPDDPNRTTWVIHPEDLEHVVDMASTGKGIVEAAERGARRGARGR